MSKAVSDQSRVLSDEGWSAQPPRPLLAASSTARFAADIAVVVLGMVSAVITARWLGPAGKGALSTLLYIGTLLSYAVSLGLGDSAIILIGKQKASLQDAVSAAILPILGALPFGVLALWLAAFEADWSGIYPAVAAASALLPLAAFSYAFNAILNSQERIAFTSAAFVATTAVTTLGLVLFVVALDLGILGGVFAGLVGSSAGLVMLIAALRNYGVSFRPRWMPSYLRSALRYGVAIESSHLLIALSQRVDLVLVYGFAGEAVAGHYAIALALGQLVIYAPFALSLAAFPRLAHLAEDDAFTLTHRVVRVGLAAGLVSAVPLLLAIPVAIPLLFGRAFEPAVAPALLLLLGGLLHSGQWLLTRALAARGNTRPLFLSFGLSLVVMVALDAALIPAFGITGAGVASVLAPAAGLVIALRYSADIRGLIPVADDFREFTTFLRALVTRHR